MSSTRIIRRVNAPRAIVYRALVGARAVGTPHLLLLSGIGPAQRLRDLGIDVSVDLPGVGANLQDHPKAQVAYTTLRPVRTRLWARTPHVLLRSAPSAHRTYR